MQTIYLRKFRGVGYKIPLFYYNYINNLLSDELHTEKIYGCQKQKYFRVPSYVCYMVNAIMLIFKFLHPKNIMLSS